VSYSITVTFPKSKTNTKVFIPTLVSFFFFRTDLAFNKDGYTLIDGNFTLTDGTVKVVSYKFWKAITYVANPVNATYQSLTISVPVTIDGTSIDPTTAPIMLVNGVGGYMPSTVAANTAVGGASSFAPGGFTTGSTPPAGAAPSGIKVSLAKLGLAAGYVIVEAGARGRTLVDASGTYYGVAPAALVDLKSAVKYLKFNKGVVPGNTDQIITTGTSAGGALSSLLGATGDSTLYSTYFAEIGSATASDAVFASGAWCPITDLENADAAYEWNWGDNLLSTGNLTDRTISAELKAAFPAYQQSLGFKGKDGVTLTADNLGAYLLKTYIQPAATKYLLGLSAANRTAYLTANPSITFDGTTATFTWANYLTHVGARGKNSPAFDNLALSSAENNLFGLGTTAARHFTTYTAGKAGLTVATDIADKLILMNPMNAIRGRSPGQVAKNWWIRVGTKDSDTSLSIVGNLAAGLENGGANVNAAMYWDGGHASNEDPADFIQWIANITGYKVVANTTSLKPSGAVSSNSVSMTLGLLLSSAVAIAMAF
jgi:hypothetical protein